MAAAADAVEQVGADFVVVANRLPVDRRVAPDGSVVWKRSPGGLVTALAPFLASQHGTWVGWSGTAGPVEKPVAEGIDVVAVELSADEIEDYYEGFSNATLWPLFHDILVKPEYRRDWWDAYVAVNERFAAEAARVAAPGATVWVHDYQLLLVPRLLRNLRPDVRIGFFLHIPFPPFELFSQLPWRGELVDGLLGADLVGFHLPGGARNFLELVRRLTDLEVRSGPSSFREFARRLTGTETAGDRSRIGDVLVGDRTVVVGAFPISIDSAAVDAAASSPPVQERAAQLRTELGSPRTLMLGVDRLDYTKGIDIRLEALASLFAEGRLDPAETVFVQLASPSREGVESYARMRDRIETLTSHINGTYGTAAAPPVRYLLQPVPRDELLAYFVAADVVLVTPMRDGMNLVAKEYVACRGDGGGALVLSEFTGAAYELGDAYLMNPYDGPGTADAIHAAATEPDDVRRARMTALRDQVMTHDVQLWATTFLDTLKG